MTDFGDQAAADGKDQSSARKNGGSRGLAPDVQGGDSVAGALASARLGGGAHSATPLQVFAPVSNKGTTQIRASNASGTMRPEFGAYLPQRREPKKIDFGTTLLLLDIRTLFHQC